jgi:hypothetical protein
MDDKDVMAVIMVAFAIIIWAYNIMVWTGVIQIPQPTWHEQWECVEWKCPEGKEFEMENKNGAFMPIDCGCKYSCSVDNETTICRILENKSCTKQIRVRVRE